MQTVGRETGHLWVQLRMTIWPRWPRPDRSSGFTGPTAVPSILLEPMGRIQTGATIHGGIDQQRFMTLMVFAPPSPIRPGFLPGWNRKATGGSRLPGEPFLMGRPSYPGSRQEAMPVPSMLFTGISAGMAF